MCIHCVYAMYDIYIDIQCIMHVFVPCSGYVLLRKMMVYKKLSSANEAPSAHSNWWNIAAAFRSNIGGIHEQRSRND